VFIPRGTSRAVKEVDVVGNDGLLTGRVAKAEEGRRYVALERKRHVYKMCSGPLRLSVLVTNSSSYILDINECRDIRDRVSWLAVWVGGRKE
jgi:hypothetical protein